MAPLKNLYPSEETVKTIEGIKQFIRNERGAELAEYAVGVALLVAIAVVVYQVLGDSINDANTGTAARVTGATWSP
jgi:Flp pilus assembly pilin Flp